MNKGLLYAIGAYSLWGVMPIYWKLMQAVPAAEILAHRIIWSLLFLALLLTLKRQWQRLGQAASNSKTLLIYLAASLLLAANWGTYIWAVNAGFIVETSLGYFINPLVNVVLGVLLLKERMRPWQWVAVGTAAAGVLYLTASYGSLPWIALTLAFTFGFYGLLKKKAPLRALDGLFLETTPVGFTGLGVSAIPMGKPCRRYWPSGWANASTTHFNRRGDGLAATIICRRRAANFPFHARHTTIYQSDFPVLHRRVSLSRTLYPGASDWLQLHLGRPDYLQRRRAVDKTPPDPASIHRALTRAAP